MWKIVMVWKYEFWHRREGELGQGLGQKRGGHQRYGFMKLYETPLT